MDDDNRKTKTMSCVCVLIYEEAFWAFHMHEKPIKTVDIRLFVWKFIGKCIFLKGFHVERK